MYFLNNIDDLDPYNHIPRGIRQPKVTSPVVWCHGDFVFHLHQSQDAHRLRQDCWLADHWIPLGKCLVKPDDINHICYFCRVSAPSRKVFASV